VTQVIVIAVGEQTFTATCEACGTTFAARLDDDLDEGIFLCRFGHAVRIERHDATGGTDAATAAA
jgi:hypothetical protein